MEELNRAFPKDVDSLLATFRGWMRCEATVSAPMMGEIRGEKQRVVKLTIQVRNDAQPRNDGGNVVFMGVGLRISDAREDKVTPSWVSGIRKSRPSDQEALRRRYDRGAWVTAGSTSRKFEIETSDERSFGETLFPQESVIYEMLIPTMDLAYVGVQVEGSVSRRHLLHFVQPLECLDQFTRPTQVEAFRALNALDFRPITAAIDGIPDTDPKSTLEDVARFRHVVEQVMAQIRPMAENVNRIGSSVPNTDVREYARKDLGGYVQSLWEACKSALESVSAGDVERMHGAALNVKRQLSAYEEVHRRILPLLARVGITPDEVGLKCD